MKIDPKLLFAEVKADQNLPLAFCFSNLECLYKCFSKLHKNHCQRSLSH